MKEVILTPEGYEKLKQEIDFLQNDKRREVAERIRQECRLMKAALADPLENRADIEDFPLVKNKEMCQSCNFQKSCYPQGLGTPPEKEYAEAIQ